MLAFIRKLNFALTVLARKLSFNLRKQKYVRVLLYAYRIFLLVVETSLPS